MDDEYHSGLLIRIRFSWPSIEPGTIGGKNMKASMQVTGPRRLSIPPILLQGRDGS